MNASSNWPRTDLTVALIGLVLLLAWDATGWDLAVVAHFGDARGFHWRDAFVTAALLHNGGRLLAWLALAALAMAAWRAPALPMGGPGRAERWRWIAVILICVLAVPQIKQFSQTSCPWDLKQFAGVARYVSHWQLGVADGGPGRCFPSGHAVAAFAFIGQFFVWRRYDMQHARVWLLAVLGLGLVYGLDQLVRGAHYPSHTLWSAWLCWVICATADRLMSHRLTAV